MHEIINTVEEFKEEREDLFEIWDPMTRQELYEEIWKEALDSYNMTTRVETLLEGISDALSYPNYSLEVLRQAVEDFETKVIEDFCYFNMEETGEVDVEEIKKKASKSSWN